MANATLLKVTLLHGCFSHFLNCANGTKLLKVSHTYPNSRKYKIFAGSRCPHLPVSRSMYIYQKNMYYLLRSKILAVITSLWETTNNAYYRLVTGH